MRPALLTLVVPVTIPAIGGHISADSPSPCGVEIADASFDRDPSAEGTWSSAAAEGAISA